MIVVAFYAGMLFGFVVAALMAAAAGGHVDEEDVRCGR